MKKIKRIIKNILQNTRFYFYKIKTFFTSKRGITRINIGSGGVPLESYCGIDINHKADVVLDLSKSSLPFQSHSVDVAICISAINYFTRERGQEIIADTYRVLKKGGVARFGVQDLKAIAKKYIENDIDFFFQKNPNTGRDRFRGETMCDKINSWFYGYKDPKRRGEGYMYDYETLSLIFKRAGFSIVEEKKYLESRVENIEKIDNRPEQMFFLEAIK